MFRILSVVLMGCFLFASESRAYEDDDVQVGKKRKIKITSTSMSLASSPKKFKNNEKENEEIFNIRIFSPLKDGTPTKVSAEREYFDKIRLELAQLEYKTELKKEHVQSPLVRKIYQELDKGNYFTRKVKFAERIVLQVDYLFDPSNEVYYNGDWVTNLWLMKNGFAPIGRKGIILEEERKALSEEEIIKQQNQFKIDIQHMLQKDGGEDNPLCEMTHEGHMSFNARMVLERNEDGLNIVAYSLEKTEFMALLENKPEWKGVTNTLHFRKEHSHINREDFDAFRTNEYWPERARQIEEGNFVLIPPPFVVPVRIFARKRLDFSSEAQNIENKNGHLDVLKK